MGKKQAKWYTVWKGKQKGVYDNWNDCKRNIHGVAGAQYKSYTSRQAAEEALSKKYSREIETSAATGAKKLATIESLIAEGLISSESICVDAACSSNPGVLERRGVMTGSNREIFHSDIYQLGTTNIGEWLALIDGMQYVEKSGKTHFVIYSDSRIALGRIAQSTIRTTLPRSLQTEKLWVRIDQGLLRLKQNTVKFNCQKRKTSERGEIPADFGRK